MTDEELEGARLVLGWQGDFNTGVGIDEFTGRFLDALRVANDGYVRYAAEGFPYLVNAFLVWRDHGYDELRARTRRALGWSDQPTLLEGVAS